MRCIVGLGNPGIKYAETRHNIGFILIDHLAGIFQISLAAKKWDSLIGKGYIGERQVLLAKPLTYMNRSGLAVAQILNFHKIPPPDLLVVHDDMDIPLGRIKIVRSGGSGGHNGVDSIIETLGTREFPRLKIGIGRPLPQQKPEHYVLEPFSFEEIALLKETLKKAAKASEAIVRQGIEEAMNLFNIKEVNVISQ
ncbi:MAG: aminoacyl-tRNA hydrolase [Thermodesulfobacteriota bacterium]|nr:aminoacyl-tRNA hydrolase [Thermodesulfobacteriota bacterium]